jgi:hypothetical protein
VSEDTGEAGGQLAVVTPSYLGDWPLFCELHESVLRYTPPEVLHYVVVPDADAALFAAAAGPRCVLIPETSLYPDHYVPVPAAVNSVLHALPGFPAKARIAAVNRRRPLRPVRGWVMQQALKLAAAERSDADVLLLLDSDVVLFRPVQASMLRRDGRVRFYRKPGAVDASMRTHAHWHAQSRGLLGLPPGDLPAPDYVSSLALWDPKIVRGLLARLREVSGEHWMDTVTRQPSFSEWTLYGLYVDELGDGGDPAAASAVMDSPLCHSYWTAAPLAADQAAEFAAGARPDDVAVLIQSKSATPLQVRRDVARQCAAAADSRPSARA